MEEHNHDNEFEKRFREKMEGFEDAPSKMAWETISSQIPPARKNTWKRFAWLLLLIPVCCVPVFLHLDSADSEIDKVNSEKTEVVREKLNSNKLSDKEINSTIEKTDNQIVAESVAKNEILRVKESFLEKANHTYSNKKTHTTKPRQRVDGDSHEILPKVGVKRTQRLVGTADSGDARYRSDSLLYNLKVKTEEENLHSSNSKNTLNRNIEKQSETNLQSILPKMELVDSTEHNLTEIAGIQTIQPKPTGKTERKWKFFVETATLYTSERITPNQDDEWILKGNESDNFTADNIGFSVGLGMSRNISERMKLDIALNYSLLRKQLNFNYQSARPTSLSTNLDSSGVLQITPNYQQNEASAFIRYQLLTSNVGFRYQLFATKPNQFLKFGAGASWLFHLKTRPKGLVVLEEKNWVHPSAYLGYEWNYPISDKMKLGVSPTINYYFSSLLTEKSSISAKPYSLGLNLRLGF